MRLVLLTLLVVFSYAYGGSLRQNSCYEPKVVGPCRAMKPRWFFNKTTSVCERFMYGGCKGNSNNFMTLDDCKKTCNPVVKEQPTLCKLKPESGDCDGKFPMFYFDAEENKCELFEYSGCQGNDNKFTNKMNCESTCKQ